MMNANNKPQGGRMERTPPRHIRHDATHRRVMALLAAVTTLLLAISAAHAGEYELAKYIPTGIGVDKSPVYPENIELCKAYEANLNSFPEVKEPFACERPINPKLADFSKPNWEVLDPAKHIDLFENMERADPKYEYFRWKGDTPEAIEKKIVTNMEYVKANIAKNLIRLKVTKLDIVPSPPRANQGPDGIPENVVRIERSAPNCNPADVKTWRFTVTPKEYFIASDDLTKVDGFSTSNQKLNVFLHKGKVYFDGFVTTRAVDADSPEFDAPGKRQPVLTHDRYEVYVSKPFSDGVVPICRYRYVE